MWEKATRAFMEAAASGTQRLVSRFDVRNNGTLYTPSGLQGVTDATVTWDETRKVRRDLTFTISPTDAQIPSLPGDLFHPVSGNEVYPYLGFEFADGSQLLAPQGVFRMSTPKNSDDGENLLLTVNGLDRSSVISQIGWQVPYTVFDGTNLAAALQDAINFLWPTALQPLVFNFAATDFAVAYTVWGANPGSSDPWQDFIDLTADSGMELFFGVYGEVVLRPIGNPSELSAVASFADGSANVMTEMDRTLDETEEHNGVQYIGNAQGETPVQVLVFDDDPESPTYWLGPWGQRPAFYTTASIPQAGQSTDDATAQLTAAAQAQLQLLLGALDEQDFNISPNPALQDGDCVIISHARMRVDAPVILGQGTLAFDVGTEEQLTGRPAVQAGTGS